MNIKRIQIGIAKDIDNNRILINNAKKGNTYICISCNNPLIPKKGNILQHHYAHKTDCKCGGESLKHIEAKELIMNNLNRCIFIGCKLCKKEIKFNSKCDISLEYSYNKYKIDVMILENKKEIGCLEVYNTSKISAEKLSFFKNNSIFFCEIKADDIIEKLQKREILDVKFINDNNNYHCIKCNNLINKIKKEKNINGTPEELYYNYMDYSNDCECGIAKINLCICKDPSTKLFFGNKICDICDKYLCRCN